MSRTTFYYVLNKISDQIEKKSGDRSTNSSRLQTVTIYKLSHGDYINTKGEMCGLAKATVCTIVSENCTVIINKLWDDSVKRHFRTSEDDIRHCMRKFGEEWRICSCGWFTSASKMS